MYEKEIREIIEELGESDGIERHGLEFFTPGQAKAICEKSYLKCSVRLLAHKIWTKISVEEMGSASTLEEIKNACRRAPKWSPEYCVGLEKWKMFSVEEIEKASTLEEIKKVIEDSPIGSSEQKRAIEKYMKHQPNFEEVSGIIEKIKTGINKYGKKVKAIPDIEISTIEEARDVCESTDSEEYEYIFAMKMWKKLTTQEVEKAANYNMAEMAFRRAPSLTAEKTTAFEKWASYFTNFYDAAKASRNYGTIACYVMLDWCTNFDQIQTALKLFQYNELFTDPVYRKGKTILQEAINYATTFEEIDKLYGQCSSLRLHSLFENLEIKWRQISKNEVGKATTFDEIHKVYSKSSNFEKTQYTALEKMRDRCIEDVDEAVTYKEAYTAWENVQRYIACLDEWVENNKRFDEKDFQRVSLEKSSMQKRKLIIKVVIGMISTSEEVVKIKDNMFRGMKESFEYELVEKKFNELLALEKNTDSE